MNPVHVKHLFDAGSVATMIATFAGWLPNIAALLTIIWTAIRIVESESGKRLVQWLKSLRAKP